MRPFIPPPVSPGAADSETERAMGRAQQAGWREGRREGEAEGLARGLAEGEAKARAELGARLAESQAELLRRRSEDSLADTLRALMAQRGQDRRRLEDVATETMRAALTMVFPAITEWDQGRSLAAVLRQAVAERDVDTLLVRGRPDTLERLERAAGEQDVPGVSLRLVPDGSQPEGVAEIGWHDGGVRYDPAATMARVAAALAPAEPVPAAGTVPSP